MVRLSRLAAIVLFLVIAFSTLSPIGLRPHIGDANMERAAAYLLFGITLAMGFPDHIRRCTIIVIGVAGLLEALQLIDPGRHARLHDALVKALAGIAGIVVVRIASVVMRRIGTAPRP